MSYEGFCEPKPGTLCTCAEPLLVTHHHIDDEIIQESFTILVCHVCRGIVMPWNSLASMARRLGKQAVSDGQNITFEPLSHSEALEAFPPAKRCHE